ncbi:MAG: 2-iminoacetate synthase, partial [Acidimicrobiaceae bacterium]
MSSVAVTLESRPDELPPESAAADVMAFADADLDRLLATAATASPADVDRALAAPHPGLDDLAALLSPSAADRLEDLAAAAHRLTVRRFGRVVRLFAPLYLSNECA